MLKLAVEEEFFLRYTGHELYELHEARNFPMNIAK